MQHLVGQLNLSSRALNAAAEFEIDEIAFNPFEEQKEESYSVASSIEENPFTC
jgi:hypothetical protein